MPPVYISGHRNPDTDAIAAAMGYAELRSKLDPGTEYVPVRLGDCNPQTKWALERAGAEQPGFLAHIKLRVGDVMQTEFPRMREEDPVRTAGLAIDHADYDLVPVEDDEGALTGVITTRALARRYIRESRQSSHLGEPTRVRAIVEVLDGKLVTGDDRLLSGRVWVQAMSVERPSRVGKDDIVVVGDRSDAQRLVIEQGAALMVISNGTDPDADVLSLAREHETTVVVSPLDTYVTARMITLAGPCRGAMEREPLTATPDELISEISDPIKESHHGAAVVLDARQHPIGLVTRSDLVSPPRRRVILVDHAEQSQSVPGIEEAEIVEILDHHHIGSIETRVPVRATFDPVGSTSTLVVEQYRRSGVEPSRPIATMLLAAVLSDTVILNSPTTTDRDVVVVDFLGRMLELDPREFGREMFESTADVSGVSAADLVRRDAKSYQSGSGMPFLIAQVEVIGKSLLARQDELLEAMRTERSSQGAQLFALMVTDVLDKETNLLVDGDVATVARAFGVQPTNGSLHLPGVMSRKKQVAPKLLSVL